MIGMSPGNAHPYSWSAIINGVFDADEIVKVGYPAVATYLTANRDTLGLPQARVTHVWAQEKRIAESIAKTTNIDHVAATLDDMAGAVDAVILARDDAEMHVQMCKSFFKAGIPVFIDKPLATSAEDLAWFAEQNQRGVFFMSCSSMRYANEVRTAKTELASLGKVELITSVGKKDWLKYGVHMLEAIFSLLDDPDPVSVRHVGVPNKDVVQIELDNGIPVTLHLFMDIAPTFQLTVFGQNAWRLIDVRNSYSMFRDNIIEFLRSVEQGRSRLDFRKTYNIIQTLIGASDSLSQGGNTIKLKARV
jgi:predicted dehydrogenase